MSSEIDYKVTDTQLNAIADAINTKAAHTGKLAFPNEFISTINNIETGTDVSDTTASTEDVLEGQVFYSASGARSVGTLTDATTTTHGLMSVADKVALEEWKALRLSIDAQGYVCQTVEVNE